MEPANDRSSPVQSRSICSRIRQWKCGVPPTWLVICAIIISQISWGLYPVIVKKYGADEEINPVIFTFYRTVGCVPVLFIWSLVTERAIIFPQPKIIALFVLTGLVGVFLAENLYIIGIYLAGPSVTSIFQSLITVWTAILAILTCTERVPSVLMVHTWAKFLGIALAVGGAIGIILTGTNVSSGEENSTTNTSVNHSNSDRLMSMIDNVNFGDCTVLIGYIALMIQTNCYTIYFLVQKKFIFGKPNCKWRDYPIAVTAFTQLFGGIFMGLASIAFATTGNVDQFIISQASIVALVYGVFIQSALCYGLMTWSNKYLPTSIINAFSPMQPLATGIASYFVTGEQLEPWQYASAAIVIGGLVLVLYSNHTDERVAKGHKALQFNDCCHQKDINTSEERSKEPLLHMNGVPTEQLNN